MYLSMDVIFISIHYSQIENKVELEKHVKVLFYTVRTNVGLGVCLNSVGCTRYFVGLI